jgi:cytochrome c553
MRILQGIVVLTLGLSIACASRSNTTSGTNGQGGGAAAPARMTEMDYDAIMKRVGPTNGGMRMKLMNNMLPDAAKDAQTLAMLFGDVERFWTQQKKMDAMKWAAEARMFATETAGAAAAGDQMKAQQAANNLLGDCKQCHGMYREGSQEAGFHIKPGTVSE